MDVIDVFATPGRQPQDGEDRIASTGRGVDPVEIEAPRIEWARRAPRVPVDAPFRYKTRLGPYVPRTGRTLNNPPTLIS